MLQVIQDFKSGKIRLAEVPAPGVAAGSVLVRTHASAISVGTERTTADVARKSLIGKARMRPDLVRKVLDNVQREGLATTIKKVKGRLDEWKPMGYSVAGVVKEVGAGVEDLLPGMRVACAGADYASHSQIVVVPKNLVVSLPDGVSYEDAAFTTIASIALQGIRRAEVCLGDNVVVLGLGLIGLMTVELLKACGANVLGMDIRRKALEWAGKVGVDRTVLLGEEDPEEAVAAWSNGRGADVVILTTATQSSAPIRMAPTLLRDRGRLVVVGVTGLALEREVFYMRDLQLLFSRSYGPGRYDPEYEEKGRDYPIGFVRWTERRNMEAVVSLMAQGKFQPSKLITHRFPITEAEKAYQTILEGTESPVGVLLTYPEEPATARRMAIQVRPQAGSLKIGVIGAGGFARNFILPQIAKCRQAQIGVVATVHGHTARMVAQKYNIPDVTTVAQEVLDDDAIRMVFIMTRHDTHAGLVTEALRRGKMVYVEKPLAVNQEQLDQIEEALRRSPAPWLMVGFNRVFSPHAEFLRKHFAHSPHFLLFRVNAGTLPAGHWSRDAGQGGRWIGEGCHFLHFARHWFAADPRGFAVSGIPMRGEDPLDNLSLFLDFGEAGTFNLLYTSRGAKKYPKEHLEVWGEGKTAILEDFRKTTVFPGKKAHRSSGQDKGIDTEIARTLQAALKGEPPPLDVEELLSTHRLLFQIENSLRQQA
jgi:predicted dehydrogenase/threonine dehydrogenase-like Zn-dependent dehydrogenase